MTSYPLSDGTRPTILIVDDEAEILVALQDLLEEDYTVLSSTSPAGALELLEAHPQVSVIVSDQRMPEMPGNVFLARARTISSAEAILLTGYADLSAVASAVNEGAISGYAHKPWEPEALRAMIAAAAERHRLRAALIFEQRIFSAFADEGLDAIAVLDATGKAVRINQRMQERESSREPEMTAAAMSADRAAIAAGIACEEEHGEKGAAGEQRWLRTRRIPFEDAAGRRFLLKIETDESARRIAEHKLHQAEKLQALGTLAGGIAHDFNNLLAVVIGNLELAMRRGVDPAKLPRYLASANEAAARGSAISRRLLSFSRQRDLEARSFRPDHVIRDVEDLAVQAMAGRATVRLDLAPGIWSVRADPAQFELAVINLCINARDAMGPGGEVVIGVRNCASAGLPGTSGEGDYVRVSVQDSGAGMSDEIKARVFEPFFTTKPHGEGTGLGLPMVRAMAEAAGGAVTIDSAPGAGTTIHLWLPRDREPSEQDEGEATAVLARSLRILLAEDDLELRATLAEQLRDAGHRLTIVDDAEQALARIDTADAFDLVITDHAMPGLSGMELALQLLARRPGLPVLIATGFAEFEPDERVTVLCKPFTGEQLRTAMGEALGRKLR